VKGVDFVILKTLPIHPYKTLDASFDTFEPVGGAGGRFPSRTEKAAM